MSKDHFVLSSVETLPDYRLRLTYADGKTFEVDLRDWIETTRALHALKDTALFGRARVGFAGRSVDWVEDEVDLGADNLRNLAIEQSGGIGHERLWNWLHVNALTLDQAADALGISRRTLIAYRDGVRPVPRTVWLACLGWEAVRPVGRGLPWHVSSAHESRIPHA